MCFGSKDNIQDEDAPRPSQFAPAQPTYASTPAKANMPISPPVSPMSPAYQQQAPQQRPQPPPVAELAAPETHRPELGGDDVAPPPGPPPSHRQAAENFAAPSGPPPSYNRHEDVAPPPGPPSSHRQAADDFAPPPGHPPSHDSRNTHSHDFAPPPGPPPSRGNNDYMAPPRGPPPSQAKPQHDWETLVPDTSLFPPPPNIFSGYDRSPATNATEAEAEAGESWCVAHPLSPPLDLDAAVLDGRGFGNVRLMAPDLVGNPFKGRLDWVGGGVWRGRTDKWAGDYCFIGFPPLYAVKRDSPLATGGKGKRTVYYEVKVLDENKKRDGISLALGYTALPYPSFRMPGWHRGSLAVHGDDGHKYINDRWGGKDFVPPMKRGETYGLGMVFIALEGGRIETEVFYTCQGREVGRWNLHEETDAEQDLPVTGLEGYHDLACAVGTFGEVAFEAVFEPGRWLFRPES